MLILKKSFFTLIEMLVVLLILSTGLALTGVKIKQAYTEQQQNSDIQQVLNLLITAQDLMLMLDADVEVLFANDPKTKQVVVRMYVEKILDTAWNKVIEKPLYLSTIRSFDFTGHHENPLRLRFTLGKMSRGILSLSKNTHISSSSTNNQVTKIYLAGYPNPINKISDKDIHHDYASINEQLYPHEIYEDLFTKKTINPSK